MSGCIAISLEDFINMLFMVPKKFNKETLPQPNKSEIKFREEPAKTVAAITFGGWASDEKIEEYKKKLIADLKAEEIPFTIRFYFLG
jgi:hypothetical protein